MQRNVEENRLTNRPKNRSFIDEILRSDDENAVKKLFEEYFYLHATNSTKDRIRWSELCFIISEILQSDENELNRIDSTKIFYELYQKLYFH